MTRPPDPPRDDLQRPLDESLPVGGGARPVPLARAWWALAAGAGRALWVGAGRAVRWGRSAPGRGARAFTAWSRGPAGRLALPAVLMVALLAGSITAGAVVVPRSASTADPVSAPSMTPIPSAPAPAPTAAPPPSPVAPSPTATGGPAGPPADVLRGWAQQMSARTAIPVVALQAYGYAELVLARTQPDCRLSWTTLAAIGRVESDHGHLGGAVVQPDGRVTPPIFGPPLDGEGDRKLIEDTDNGQLDGDPIYDRAIGPMQFIPESWRLEQVDATGDGVADPHNVHDAALAAANYLCRLGRDLSAATDWWAAVLSYNAVQAYAEAVFDAANDYGRRSRA